VSGGAARALTQDIGVDGDIWMVRLATYSISAVPAVSVLTDVRDFADAETQQFFVPISFGTYASLGYYPTLYAVSLAAAGTTKIAGTFRMPSNYITDMTITPVYMGSSGAAGDGVFFSGVYWGTLGEAAPNSDTTGPSTIAVDTAGDLTALPAVTLTTPSLDEFCHIYTERDGDDVADDYVGTVDVFGWMVQYFGWKR